tara:strand:- start:157 stop:372 length:216 start_codon:yes stop_codon:yes gene_type:complete
LWGKSSLGNNFRSKYFKLKENKMRKYINIISIWGQLYLTPFVKVTHDKTLNGDIELIIGWFNIEIVITLWK